MADWFTADWHLGDARLHLLDRPAVSAKEMAERLVAEHNALVAPDDRVFMLGDAFSRGAADISLLGGFNGRITMLRGNHDTLPREAYLRYVEEFAEDGLELAVEGIPCWLTHYPAWARQDRFNLVGHVHGAWRVQSNMLNVGVDAHHLRPVPAARIKFYFDAITGIYDDDIFAADHPANAAHRGRGIRGSYADHRSTPN